MRKAITAVITAISSLLILPAASALAQSARQPGTTVAAVQTPRQGEVSPVVYRGREELASTVRKRQDPYYTVRKGDTLSRIYGPRYWPDLWWANRNKIKDPSDIRAGWRLVLPPKLTPSGAVWKAALAATGAGAGPAPWQGSAGPAHAAAVSTAVSTAVSSATGYGIWDCIEQHEGGGYGWTADTGNGYYGGLQFTAQTWDGYGGQAYAPTANLASPADQVAVAQKVLASQGWGAWPVSSVACGAAQAYSASRIVLHRAAPRTYAGYLARLAAFQWAVDNGNGRPYEWGGTGPDFDCSGLVMMAYRHAGIYLPRTVEDMVTSGLLRQTWYPRRGDVVVYFSGGYAYHIEFYDRPGWEFGAHDYGNLTGFDRLGWAPPAFYTVR